MAVLNWLHLSDWHQGGGDFDRKVVADALLDDIRARTKIDPDLKRIEFVYLLPGRPDHSSTHSSYSREVRAGGLRTGDEHA